VQLLEPILFTGVRHTIVTTNTQENEEVQLGFAHDEGALIIACRPNYAESNRLTFADTNDKLVVGLRTTDSVAVDVVNMSTSPDTIWMRTHAVQGLVDTAVGGEFVIYNEDDWDELPGGGVIIASNPFGEFRNPASGPVMGLGIAFKRVIFDANELVRFVALRRR